jgi:hypothetical protein
VSSDKTALSASPKAASTAKRGRGRPKGSTSKTREAGDEGVMPVGAATTGMPTMTTPRRLSGDRSGKTPRGRARTASFDREGDGHYLPASSAPPTPHDDLYASDDDIFQLH